MSEVTTNRTGLARVAETTAEWRRLAGIALVVMAAQFMTVLMLGAAIAPNYDFHGGAISDLGVIPETALLFNASLVLVGALTLVGGYAYYRTHGARWLLGLYVVAAVGAIGAGLVPLDGGGLHGLSALLAFLCFNLLALGTAARVEGALRGFAVLAGVVGLAFVAIMAVGDAGNPAVFGPIGHGGAERMIVYPVMLWLLAFGGSLLAPEPRAS